MENNKYYVYEHWYDNKCIYVGSGNLKRAKGKTKNNKYNEFAKDKKIEIRIVKEFNNKKESLILERELTLKYKNKGQAQFNINIANNHSEETKIKQRLVAVERFKRESSPRKGVKLSLETKEKLSLAKKGKKQTKEHIENNRASNTGKKRSNEFKSHISKVQLIDYKITNLNNGEERIISGVKDCIKYIGCSLATFHKYKNNVYKNFKIEQLRKRGEK